MYCAGELPSSNHVPWSCGTSGVADGEGVGAGEGEDRGGGDATGVVEAGAQPAKAAAVSGTLRRHGRRCNSCPPDHVPVFFGRGPDRSPARA
jgi:hypothetical protein